MGRQSAAVYLPNQHKDLLGCVYTSCFAGVFELDGDEVKLEVGEEGGVEPVVAGGGLAVVLHAVEDAFRDVPPLVRLPVMVPWVRAVPLGRHDRRQAERLGQQPGGILLVRALHERAERGHGAAPVGRVVPVARAQMDLDDRALAVGYHMNLGVPPSPGDADGPGAPFFGAPMIRSSRNAVNRRSIAPSPDQRSNRRQTVTHLPQHSGRPLHGAPARHIHSRALTNV